MMIPATTTKSAMTATPALRATSATCSRRATTSCW